MTSEQPDQPRPSVDDAGSPPAGTGGGVAGRESVRTAGETSVDEAMGSGEEPTR